MPPRFSKGEVSMFPPFSKGEVWVERGEAPLKLPPIPYVSLRAEGEAISSLLYLVDCFVAALLAMTSKALFLSPHHLQKLLKQVGAVPGAGGGFGVILDAKYGQLPVAQSGYCAIVNIYIGNLQLAREAVGVNGVAMILGSDVNLAAGDVSDGVVAAAVSKLQLEGLGAKGTGNNLIAEADAHHRLFARHFFNGIYYVVQQFRVTRTRGEEDAIGFPGMVAGTAVTRQPILFKVRRIEYFKPQSRTTMWDEDSEFDSCSHW